MNVRGVVFGLWVVLGVPAAAWVLMGPSRAAAATVRIEWQADDDVAEAVAGPSHVTGLNNDEPPDGPEDRPGRMRGDRERRGRHKAGRGRPPRGEGKGWPDHATPDSLDAETIGRAMEVIRTKLPAFHEKLEQSRRHSPMRFRRTMAKVLPVVREYIHLRDREPELAETIIEEFRIEERLRELGRAYLEAEDRPEEREEMGAEIERLVREQLELRLQRRVFRLDEFERRLHRQMERLERQRARLQEEMERRDEWVARRVEEVKSGKPPEEMRRHRPRPAGPEDEFGERPRRGDARRPPKGSWEDRHGPRGPRGRREPAPPPEEPED